MGYLLLYSPYCFAIWVFFLGICLGAILLGKRIFKITNEDIINRKGSLLPMSFAVWGINIAVIYVSTLIMVLVIFNISYFNNLYGDCMPAGVDNTVQTAVAYICWVAIYPGLFSFAYFLFKKYIKVRAKRNKLFFTLLGCSTVAWAITLYIIFFAF